ncbi:MAG: hypothetical protein BGO01_01275 [Armatimonadetes bacterium 55-13]|nr:hypothetical protein [Armatimonadota bacterium]OJU65581.1 MAG: hypothetical protein BGO01_01275 [Armatimonadetes bacterium 55-13]
MIPSLFGSGVLLAGDRTEYRLGKKIAEGGEGIVYRVEGRDDIVAKIYREFDFTREAKLRGMVARATKRLHRVSAWPLSPLQGPDSKTVGFIMQRLESWQPLHSVYQVKHRLDNYPNRTWAFLVRASRNLAVCVHDLHEADLVLGDVNESNVLVDDRAMVKIIDADSFQIEIDSRLYPCKVGKSELLPPELLGASFKDTRRTQEHDRFSLAILIFQTLVFGRHPFAGRPKKDEELPLEACIQKGYYAYTQQRDVPLGPPPNIDIKFLPEDIRDLFERAFGSDSARRPSANEWFSALKGLEDQLKSCPENSSHKHWMGTGKCPWCEMEERGSFPVFRSSVDIAELPEQSDQLWKEVQDARQNLPLPDQFERPKYQDFQPAELSGPEKFFGKTATRSPIWFWAIFLPMQAVLRGQSPLAASILVLVVLALIPYAFFQARNQLRRRKLLKADAALQKMWLQYGADQSVQTLNRRYEELRDMHEVLNGFDEYVQQARKKALETKYRPQLESFLRKYSLLAADIGPYGREKLSALYDSGYKTAADIGDDKLKFAGGQSSEIRQALMNWRTTLESQFWATSAYSLTASEERQLLNKMRKQALTFRKALQEGPEELRRLSEEAEERRQRLLASSKAYEDELQQWGPSVLAYERMGRR